MGADSRRVGPFRARESALQIGAGQATRPVAHVGLVRLRGLAAGTQRRTARLRGELDPAFPESVIPLAAARARLVDAAVPRDELVRELHKHFGHGRHCSGFRVKPAPETHAKTGPKDRGP